MLDDNPWVSLVGMVITVAAVIGLAYWFTRYVVGSRRLGGLGLLQRDGALQILAQTQVGKDQRLAVVRAGSRFFLLGMTPQSITMLAELSEEEAAVWIKDPADPAVPKGTAFQKAFQQAFKNEKR